MYQNVNPRKFAIPIKTTYRYSHEEGDRFFFAAPLLVGGLLGGALVSASRPRPVYVTPPYQPYYPPGPYGSTSYNYYYPTYR